MLILPGVKVTRFQIHSDKNTQVKCSAPQLSQSSKTNPLTGHCLLKASKLSSVSFLHLLILYTPPHFSVPSHLLFNPVQQVSAATYRNRSDLPFSPTVTLLCLFWSLDTSKRQFHVLVQQKVIFWWVRRSLN